MLLAVAVALFAWDEAGATTSVVTAGPFTLTFYNNGDSDGSTSGVQNWTAQQMDDAAAGVAAWSGTIYNAPGRQVNLHLF